MPEPETGPPTDVETFEWAGCRVELVDAADIIAAAGAQRVELLHGAAFPAPVRQVRFSVGSGTRDDRPVHLLDTEIHVVAGPSRDWIRAAVLGNDPLGVLLRRRLDAGDDRAARIVDGVGTVAAKAYRRLRPDHAPARTTSGADTAVREDEAVGLRATVTEDDGPGDERIVRLRAAVAAETVSAAHLQAMFCLVLDMVVELVGNADELAGRAYVLSRHPDGAAPEPDTTETVTLDQVGGLPDEVTQLRQIAVSFRHPQAMARWGARRPQGILMYGPPGTGKTMLARALAHEIGATFREIRTPEILDKWLGASERNIKRIFRDARRYRRPTVLLFDEFDSIISYAGAGGDAASQAVNAVAGIFKQEMNNLIDENPNVIVVATTNFPHRVDESLIRSGRFDIKLAIPRPDEAGRADIVGKMIRQLATKHAAPGFRMFADDVDPRGLARACAGMTGADIKEALRRVQLDKAMQEARSGAVSPPISQDDLLRSFAELSRAGA